MFNGIRGDASYYLILGDTHIPDRAKFIPDAVREFLEKFSSRIGGFKQILFTGDLVTSDSTVKFLTSLLNDRPAEFEDVSYVFTVSGFKPDNPPPYMYVEGNMDIFSGNRGPIALRFRIFDEPEIYCGLIHGHQVSPRGDPDGLAALGERIGVKILVSGHTHADFVVIRNKILLINPGSAVGAWSFIATGIPSFIIAAADPKGKLEVRTYKYMKGKLEYTAENYDFGKGYPVRL